MINRVSIDDFIAQKDAVPLADVRTPAEFEQGHIPGAINLPLFTNEERVLVGTTYKQVGREAAILLGFDLTGPKWSSFIRQALMHSADKKIALHCWRGGMRSGAMAWALDLYGFDVYLIEGGYKSYRRWVLQQFEPDFSLMVLGGMTGSGKTKILYQLKLLGEQIIDLEDLAQHLGSSYGSMNKLIQPTQEQFENNFANKLTALDRSNIIWVENESSSIGKRIIPRAWWKQMVASILVDVNVPVEDRVQSLTDEYGSLDKEFLIEGTERIRKRLGPLQTRDAIAAIKENRMMDFIRQVIVYYDKTYRIEIASRPADRVFSVSLHDNDPAMAAKKILTGYSTGYMDQFSRLRQ